MSKAKLAVVKTQQKDNNEWLREFYAGMQKERQRYTPSKHERGSIIGELIDAINQHFIESAFNFRFHLGGVECRWSEHAYLGKFIDKLQPYARRMEKRLRSALPDNYPNSPLHEPDSELTSMVCDIEDAAFIIGVFVGAKVTGASAETLDSLRKNLIF